MIPADALASRLLELSNVPFAAIGPVVGAALIVFVGLALLGMLAYGLAEIAQAKASLTLETDALGELKEAVRPPAGRLPAFLDSASPYAGTIVHNACAEIHQTISSTGRPAAEDSVISSVEEALVRRVQLPRLLANVSVFVGLMGTLFGLTMTVLQLHDAADAASKGMQAGVLPGQESVLFDRFDALGKSFVEVFQYTGYAFVSSFAGVAVSVWLLFALNSYSKKCSGFLASFRSSLITSVEPAIEVLARIPSEAVTAGKMQDAAEVLSKNLPIAIVQLVNVSDQIKLSAENLGQTTEKTRRAAETLSKASDTLTQKLEGFNAFLARLTEQTETVGALHQSLAESATRMIQQAQESMERLAEDQKANATRFLEIQRMHQEQANASRELLASSQHRESEALTEIANVLREQQNYLSTIAGLLRDVPPVAATQKSMEEDRRRFEAMTAEFAALMQRMPVESRGQHDRFSPHDIPRPASAPDGQGQVADPINEPVNVSTQATVAPSVRSGWLPSDIPTRPARHTVRMAAFEEERPTMIERVVSLVTRIREGFSRRPSK